MARDFEDHCWKDIVPPEVLKVYECYRRELRIGKRPALLAIDLYDLVYRGGPHPPHELLEYIPIRAASTLGRRSSPPRRCSPLPAPPGCRCST